MQLEQAEVLAYSYACIKWSTQWGKNRHHLPPPSWEPLRQRLQSAHMQEWHVQSLRDVDAWEQIVHHCTTRSSPHQTLLVHSHCIHKHLHAGRSVLESAQQALAEACMTAMATVVKVEDAAPTGPGAISF